MDWLKELLEKAVITDGVLDVDAIMSAVNTEFPKHAVPKEAHEAEVKEVRLNSAIRLAIQGKVHDEELAAGLIDQEKLAIGDDGQIVGLDDQIKTLKESKVFLFVDEKPGPKIRGAKPAEGDPSGTPPARIGSSFAQSMNDRVKPVEHSIWK